MFVKGHFENLGVLVTVETKQIINGKYFIDKLQYNVSVNLSFNKNPKEDFLNKKISITSSKFYNSLEMTMGEWLQNYQNVFELYKSQNGETK